MTPNTLEILVKNRCALISDTLAKKGREYARFDRLSNFKRAAALARSTPERALVGMQTKHIVSILDMVDDLDLSVKHPLALWQEKIGDAINYLILLEALIYERAEQDRSETG